MLEALFDCGADARRDPELLREVGAHDARVRASARRADRGVVAAAEALVQRSPAAIAFDAGGHATLSTPGRDYAAGRFDLPSIGDLDARARARPGAGAGRARLWLVDGAAPATDIGSLQATAPEGSLFQVASQFNCLEAPGPCVVPVADYFGDSTQGPRAAISAFPATLVRHYAAPGRDGARFVQRQGGAQLDLLEDACDPDVARPRNGYLDGRALRDARALLASLGERFERIRVGVVDGAEVAMGYAWDGGVADPAPRIAQVFTSTLAGGGYGAAGHHAFDPLCEVLLGAAYAGTLLAAAALGARVAVLTLIGGGVFGNDVGLIWDAIARAIDRVEPLLARDLEVVVNGRDLTQRLPLARLMRPLRARGGALLSLDMSGAAVTR